MQPKSITRRGFLKVGTAAAVGLAGAPYLACGRLDVTAPMTRSFGKLGFDVTTFGLGGQASIQWTPHDVDPVKIILKAFESGTNYFDTSNLYGPSQTNFGAAFRTLDLVPGRAGYDDGRRRSIFLTTKTGLRYGKGTSDAEDLFNVSNGGPGLHAAEDVRRSLSQIFGDDNGSYPEGAYLDMVLMHNITSMSDVDAVYEGLADPDPEAERIGAFAALRDLRDGTNLTGLNPKEESLIRHIGFSGHHSPPVMIEMLQRDEENLLDGMLVAINANDRLNFNMQHNVIPIAAAKNMGIIGMKVFADGAMYGKGAHWSREPEHVVRTVGGPGLPSRPLVEYALTTPGIHTAIIGIGQIDDDPDACQLTQNVSAAQIEPGALSQSERLEIETLAATAKGGETNYFQIPAESLGPPRQTAADHEVHDGHRNVILSWHTAFAGREPLSSYEIWRDGERLAELAHQPQTDRSPFVFEDELEDSERHRYQIASVDASGEVAKSEPLIVAAIR